MCALMCRKKIEDVEETAMNTKQCRYIVTLVEKKSFSAAAKALMISQPSLSQYVQRIEEECGTKLIDRSSSEIRLTPEGEYYYQTAERILEEEDRLVSYFNDVRKYKTGKIKVAISSYAGTFMMPGVLSEFYKEYPDIDIELIDFASLRQIEGDIRREFDIALTTIPSDKNLFHYELITREEYYLIVPKSFPVNRTVWQNGSAVQEPGEEYPTVDLKEFAEVPFITWQKGVVTNDAFDAICEANGITPRQIVKCYSSAPMFYLACAQIGAAIMPIDSILNMLGTENADKICVYRILNNNLGFERAIVYTKGKYITKPMRYLIDLMKKNNR